MTTFTAEQTEAEALELERRASQLRGIHRQRRQAIEDRLAASRHRLSELTVLQKQPPGVSAMVDADATVREAHQRFTETQQALAEFLKRYLPRHVPAAQEGELTRLRAAAIDAETAYRGTVEDTTRRIVAERHAEIEAEIAKLQKQVAELETRLAD